MQSRWTFVWLVLIGACATCHGNFAPTPVKLRRRDMCVAVSSSGRDFFLVGGVNSTRQLVPEISKVTLGAQLELPDNGLETWPKLVASDPLLARRDCFCFVDELQGILVIYGGIATHHADSYLVWNMTENTLDLYSTTMSNPSSCVKGATSFWCFFGDALARFDAQALAWDVILPSTLQKPRTRTSSVMWFHQNSSSIYLGFGRSPVGGSYLNDIWRFDISTTTFDFLSDSERDIENSPGKYGALRVFSPGVFPSARADAVFASHGDLLYIGFGTGVSARSQIGALQDLWVYSTNIAQYAWLSGSSEANAIGFPFPFQGTSLVIDPSGIAFLVGGEYRYGSDNIFHLENDVWAGIWTQNMTQIPVAVDAGGSLCYGVGRLLPSIEHCGGACAVKGDGVECPEKFFEFDSPVGEQQVVSENPLVVCDNDKCLSFHNSHCVRQELECDGQMIVAPLLPDVDRCRADPGAYYLSEYPDIDNKFQMSPITHWKTVGRFEGKSSCWPGGSWSYFNTTNNNCEVTRYPLAIEECKNQCFSVAAVTAPHGGNGWVGRPCKSMCVSPNHRNHCACPISRIDPYCSTTRPYMCRMKLVAPFSKCEPSQGTVDPVCILVSLENGGHVTFEFELECFFTNRVGLQNYTIDSDGFSYVAQNGTQWALAEGEQFPATTLRIKPFNFYTLSDDSGVALTNVSISHIMQQENPVLSVDFSALDRSRFFTGNRVFVEVVLSQIRHYESVTLAVVSFHVDFAELPHITPYPKAGKRVAQDISAGSSFPLRPVHFIFGLAALNVGLIVLVWVQYRKRKPKTE